MSFWQRLFGSAGAPDVVRITPLSATPVKPTATPLPQQKDAAADARLTVPPAQGASLREYATAYVFEPAENAKRAYTSLQAAILSGKDFPFAAPYQIALVHGRFADFIAVLVRLPTANDESVAVHRQIVAWFSDAGVGAFNDYEALTDNLPGKLSLGLKFLPDKYTVLEIIDKVTSSSESIPSPKEPEAIDQDQMLKKCRRCGTITLTKPEFIGELAQNGITVSPSNLDDYRASGRGFGNYGSVMNDIRTTYDNVQKRRAFICKSCKSTYCMECLMKYAPSSANGGKACPQCGGGFTEV